MYLRKQKSKYGRMVERSGAYFSKNMTNAPLVEHLPDRLEPVVSVNTEEVSARQKVLWGETILILGS